jgi:hypothetical protein
MDLKKRLDSIFYQQYPEYSHVPEARFQFYQANWRPLLEEMVNNALILSEALSKEEKAKHEIVDEGEIKKEIEEKFGPNVVENLNKAGLTYQEVFEEIREKKIMNIMLWTTVYSKVFQQVTPQKIQQEYNQYLTQHPEQDKLKYQVLTIKGKDKEHTQHIASAAHAVLVNEGLESLDTLKSIVEKKLEDSEFSLQVSQVYENEEKQVSKPFLSQLVKLTPNVLSAPIEQSARDQSIIYRIFILLEKTKIKPESFEKIEKQLVNQLHNELIPQKQLEYFKKLRKEHGIGERTADPTFVPFVLE